MGNQNEEKDGNKPGTKIVLKLTPDQKALIKTHTGKDVNEIELNEKLEIMRNVGTNPYD